MRRITLLVVSDSTGETGEAVARAWVSQFGDAPVQIERCAHVTTPEAVDEIFSRDLSDTVLLNSVVMPEVSAHLHELSTRSGVAMIDLFDRALGILEEKLGMPPKRLPGLTRELDCDYFNKIESIEFAVKYDDGKDRRGLKKADVVLIGVSRTSKTPLSMILANKGYNVANLPLVPEISLPEEVYQVDPRRIVGLVISPEKLNDIREARLQALGLSITSSYADEERIRKELDYAKEVFDRLGCKVLDVSEQTIEQSAAQIIQYLTSHFGGQVCRHQIP
ncbi:MAG: pyruvate, water dikinase regulatory protein [Ndongobacter sp.]|nr:pyruvate, water dikinase regulatory protein [Ndongobacter sp.]